MRDAGVRESLNEYYDGYDEYKGCQGCGDRPTQLRLAQLSTQVQNSLSHQDVGC